MIVLTRRKKLNLDVRIAKVRITLLRHTKEFYMEVTRLLGVYLNTKPQFEAHKNLTVKKAKKARDRVQYLGATRVLALELVQKL